MPTEKNGDDTQHVEQKQASDPNTDENQNEQMSNNSKVADNPKPDKKVESDKKPVEKSETKSETEPVKEKEDKKKDEDQGEAKESDQPQKQVKKPAIGGLEYYSEVRKDLPEIKPGDVIRVSYRVIEGGKERIQVFEGTVIALKNSGISRTITVRKTSFGISVERIFPLNSKLIQKIEIKKHSKVRRAKLYYLRKLKGKAARLKELR